MCTLDHVEIFYGCLLQTEKKKKGGFWNKILHFWEIKEETEEERRAKLVSFANYVDGLQKANKQDVA